MTSVIRKTLRNSTLALVAALGFAATAQAQQASGNIMGDAVAGDTIVAHNEAIGFRRELTVDKDGRYNMRRLPLGVYVVTVKHADGSQTAPPKQVRVQPGVTARVQ
ncbi:carboxypeptidase family protein [Luteimonas cucumeris]|uniref:Carboxypeptidase family protein n=1 Tax=Luteimonas cucumeris TaxID=985012 RepID=A0A562LE86_9GAMM|nr:carboxypeptidase-like regulatory domain-containing protein [Luteimonas cucumeris]TWI05970.1 carboxypeptidase family protein [Luteimonas cucumeris]